MFSSFPANVERKLGDILREHSSEEQWARLALYTSLTKDNSRITMIRFKRLRLEAKLGLYKMSQEDHAVDTSLRAGRGFICLWEYSSLFDSADAVCFSAFSRGL